MKRARTFIAITASIAIGIGVGVPLGVELAPNPEPPATREITARTFEVVRIIDGDTFTIRYDGEPTGVRVADIDAPERGEPGYAEARDALAELIAGETITLTFHDPDDKRDSFGRLLASVEVDGVDVGEVMLGRGLAVEYER